MPQNWRKAKIADAQREEILDLYRRGASYTEIAQGIEYSTSVVGMVVKQAGISRPPSTGTTRRQVQPDHVKYMFATE